MTAKQMLLSTLIFGITGNALAMEETPGERARKEYPMGYRITNVTGGTIGAVTTTLLASTACALADIAEAAIGVGGTPKLGITPKLVGLGIVGSSLYFGWKGGTGVSKSAWNATWYANKKITDLKDLMKKE